MAYDREMAMNRELVLASIEAIQQGDLDRGLKDWAEDAVLINNAGVGAGPAGSEGAWYGRDGFRAWLREVTTTLTDYRMDVLDAREAGDTVMVTFRETGRGRASGIMVEQRIQVIYTVSQGKITRVESSGLSDHPLSS
jgi:ketosteroid isomerase-like protein